MKFGIVLLLIISLLSIIGTVLPQGYQLGYYEAQYSPILYDLISTFNLHEIYSSWWFTALGILLCLNLLACSITRIRPILKRVMEPVDVEDEVKNSDIWQKVNVSDKNQLFKDLGYNNIKSAHTTKGTLYYEDKGFIGHIGSWLTHLGLLVIIVFFIYGRVNGFEVYLYGVPESTHEIEGTDYDLYIDDFEIKFREDWTVIQYTTDLEIIEDGHVVSKGQTMVNSPFRTDDLNIYQNSTGWAVNASLYKDDELVSDRVLYNSEFYREEDDKIVLQFVDFYPDLDTSDPTQLRNLSPLPNHPVMLYALFYNGHRVDMGLVHMGDTVEYEGYKFFIDEPQMFTLLQINNDPGIVGAAIGGFTMLVGLILAFYVHPRKIRLLESDGQYKLYTKAYRNDKLYEDKVNEILDKVEVE